MKPLRLTIIMLLPFFLQSSVAAATLENLDLEKYDYQIITRGDTVVLGTINEQATLYGICEYGCLVTLLETDQTFTVKPGDHVVIDQGVLKLKE